MDRPAIDLQTGPGCVSNSLQERTLHFAIRSLPLILMNFGHVSDEPLRTKINE